MNMTSRLTEDERKAYELYLLAEDNQELIKQALTQLVEGSDHHRYMCFLDKLKRAGIEGLSKEDKAYLSQIKQSAQGKNVSLYLRSLLLTYDTCEDPIKRKELVDELISAGDLDFNFDHQKAERADIFQDTNQELNDDRRRKDATLESKQWQLISNAELIDLKIKELRVNEAKIADDFTINESLEEMEKMEMLPLELGLKTANLATLNELLNDNIADGVEHELDFTLLRADAVHEYIKSTQDQKIASIENPTLFRSLANYVNSLRTDSPKEFAFFTCEFASKLTVAQMDQLVQIDRWFLEDEDFIGAQFQKIFCIELSEENQQLWTTEEKIQNLERLFEYAQNKNLPKTLQLEFLEEILTLGPKIGKYSLQHFKKLIALADKQDVHIFLDYKPPNSPCSDDSNQKQKPNWKQYIGNVRQGPWRRLDTTLYKTYLNHFCHESGGSLAEFAKDFTHSFLKTIENEVKVFTARDGFKSLDHQEITLQQFKDLSDLVVLEFCKSNKEQFSVQEEVQLKLTLKNISRLHVKVFEFNTETYYKKNLQPINKAVKLDGLEASEMLRFDYEQPPNIKFTETFTFPSLANRVGLFIVEFMGNGVSARAVIKKGSLSFVHRSTIAGHLLYILDDKKEICSGDRTGVWFDGKFYQAEREKGRIIIPYADPCGQDNLTAKIIMIHENFAQIGDFERKCEEFDVDADFFLQHESILVGSSASLIIKPQLTINGRAAKLSMLQDVKLTVKTDNYIDEIPITRNYEGLSFEEGKELSVQFQVPINLKSIHVDLQCGVLYATTKQVQGFCCTHSFNLITQATTSQMCDAFLRRQNGEYHALILGKNGEPIIGQKVQIQIKHRLSESPMINDAKQLLSRSNTIELCTDIAGEIHLGKLVDVLKLRVMVTSVRVAAEWNLNLSNDCQSWTYPEKLQILEGESIQLPINLRQGQTQLERKWLSIVRSINGVVIENCFSSVKLQKVNGYHTIVLDGLQQGDYSLRFLSGQIQVKIKIQVSTGCLWGSADGFILNKHCLQENLQQNSIVKIATLEISKKDKEHEVKVILDDFSRNAHVHAFATQFVSYDQTDMAKQIEMRQRQKLGKSIFNFAKWENFYDSNRAMADEIRYVFDRKQLETQLGNTLDKPTLLLNKNFVRNTVTEDEVLSGGQDYNQGYEEMQTMPKEMEYRAKKGKRVDKKKKKNIKRRSSWFDEDASVDVKSNQITELQNFLKCPPLQKLNLQPIFSGDQATITFSSDLSPYTQLTIVVVDQESVAQRTIDLESLPIQKRDLRLQKAIDQDKGLTEARQALTVQASQQIFIEDIINTEVQLIDDLNKVAEILKEIRKCQGGDSAQFKDFDLTKRWLRLTTAEKDRYFSEYCCNELHIFIRNKDPAYFNNVVRPFIQCKMEKLFVDHYLLGNKSKVIEYAQSHLIQKLNAMEQCLLIDVMCQNGHGKQALAIAERMQLQYDAQAPKGQEKDNYDKQIFDIVLNLNTLNDEKVGLSQFKQQKEEEQAEMERRYSSSESDAVNNDYNDEMIGECCPEADYECVDEECEGVESPRMESKSALRSMMKMKRMSSNNDDDDDYLTDIRSKALNKYDFEELEQTSEFMETHYYKETDVEKFGHLIKRNQFWCDLARHYANPNHGSFMTSSFTANSGSERESFLALCFLDLKQDASEAVHDFKPNDTVGVTVTAACNLILFRRCIKECAVALKSDVMVIHRYQQENYYQEDSIQEFLSNTIYECEVIITNVSPKVKQFNILYQIPQGSMPMGLSKQMKCQNMTLQPFTTSKLFFLFYFPTEGKFSHFPSNVSVDEIVVSRGGANKMQVVKSRRITKIETFSDLLIAGTQEQILNYLETEQLYSSKKGFSFSSMLYLLKQKSFFDQVIQILRKRCIYEGCVWSYAFYHKDDTELMKEALLMTHDYQQLVSKIGCYFESGLLSSEPIDGMHFMHHLEYHPMVNKRAHIVGKNSKIQNVTFRNTYDSFLTTMAYKPKMNDEDKLCFVYYLQLQDRFQQAIDLLKKIPEPSPNAPFRIQYDYLQAYFDFFTDEQGGYKTARRIVMKYDNYPVASWRMLFLAIQDQLNEFDGEFDNEEEMATINTTDEELKLREQRKVNKKNSQKKEPNMSVSIDKNGTLKIDSVNLQTFSVQYYIINAELLFSRQPFLKDNTEGFSYVKPYHTLIHQALPKTADEQQMNSTIASNIAIPEKLKNQNMVIEITSGDIQKFITFYSNQLKVTVLEQYGELKVTHSESGVPLPRSYVKVFSKTNKGDVFYRDGYTDIRGKFEYSQTSGDKLKDVIRFAILVQNEKHGSKIVECAPPKGTVGTGVESFAGQKQARLEVRQNYAKSKKC